MTPVEMARLHAQVFTAPRPYTAEEFSKFLGDETCFICALGSTGFALGRLIGTDSELITIVVAPESQRSGIGRALLSDFESTGRLRGANRVFLEVAENNAAALNLYVSAGYETVGRRKGYYRDGDGRIDALTMAREV